MSENRKEKQTPVIPARHGAGFHIDANGEEWLGNKKVSHIIEEKENKKEIDLRELYEKSHNEQIRDYNDKIAENERRKKLTIEEFYKELYEDFIVKLANDKRSCYDIDLLRYSNCKYINCYDKKLFDSFLSNMRKTFPEFSFKIDFISRFKLKLGSNSLRVWWRKRK